MDEKQYGDEIFIKALAAHEILQQRGELQITPEDPRVSASVSDDESGKKN